MVLDITVQQNLWAWTRFSDTLREHDSDLDDRAVHNIFATLNTWQRTRDILIAGKILAERDYAEKSPKPYTEQELKDLFAAMKDQEKLQPEKVHAARAAGPWRKFRLKRKSEKKSAKDRFCTRSRKNTSQLESSDQLSVRVIHAPKEHSRLWQPAKQVPSAKLLPAASSESLPSGRELGYP